MQDEGRLVDHYFGIDVDVLRETIEEATRLPR